MVEAERALLSSISGRGPKYLRWKAPDHLLRSVRVMPAESTLLIEPGISLPTGSFWV